MLRNISSKTDKAMKRKLETGAGAAEEIVINLAFVRRQDKKAVLSQR